MSYRGMRWFKCDLQMQTPLSPHWRDEATRLRASDSEDRKREVARLYLKRCHEVELEVLGITDHNFAPRVADSFLHLLRQENAGVAEELRRPSLHVLPGFEVEADVGKGCHVLAIFERDTPLETVEARVTELDLPFDRRFGAGGEPKQSTKRLVDLIRVIQGPKVGPGLVIAAHSQATKGIFDNDHLADWLQQEEATNEELLCLEVPKPVSRMSVGWQKLLGNGNDCDPAWRRKRPIACIMSSDCYRMSPDGADPGNFIGFRHTWIKMSEPTIEALRQAFLDHESRISLEEAHPDSRLRHGRIVKVSFANAAYLGDGDVEFSPHLNCLIGGRGSGKSSILEYIGFLTNREADDAAGAAPKRLRETVTGDTRLALDWVGPGGVTERFEFDPAAGVSKVVGREVSDPATVFRQLGIQVISQGQITQITSLNPETKQPDFLLRQIDLLCGQKLVELKQEESILAEEVKSLLQLQRVFERVTAETASARQQAEELGRQTERLASVQGPAENYRAGQEAEQYLNGLETYVADAAQRILDLAEELRSGPTAIGAALERWPGRDFFGTLEQQAALDFAALATELEKLAEGMAADWQKRLHENAVSARAELSQTGNVFAQACQQLGLQADDVAKIKEVEQQRRVRLSEVELKQGESERLRKMLEAVPSAWEKLHQNWKGQTELRRKAMDEILSKVQQVPTGEKGKSRPFIEFSFVTQADFSDFKTAWRAPDLAPDGRSTLGRKWEDLGDALLQQFESNPERVGSPWALVELWFQDPTLIPAELQRVGAEFSAHLRDTKRDAWERSQLIHVSDAVDLKLYRESGDLAGSLAQLSDGQRNTAMLSILLAQGDNPIVIDQPEDEVDSDYVFRELVPLLRRVKQNRQIILNTHNANLPVNGDAELVYALECKEGRGHLRAQGGMDREPVKQAILDIMEGSKAAFERRREKYKF